VFDFTSPPSLVDRYQASPDLRKRVFTDPFDTISVMTMNLAVRPLDDVHVRRAINFAIDKNRLRPILKRYVTNSSIATHLGLDSEEENLLQNYAPFGDGSGDLEAAKAEHELKSTLAG
jgi:ABC-type oligopeptide transport system substrate-binding subunit